jgi:hypothetical protein
MCQTKSHTKTKQYLIRVTHILTFNHHDIMLPQVADREDGLEFTAVMLQTHAVAGIRRSCAPSDFRRDVDQICALLGYYAA